MARKSPALKAPARSMHEHHSVSIRKISNGYVVSTSHDAGGEYKSTETYHPKKPKVVLPTPGKPGTAKQMASKMKRYL